jgi:hypothetical protein
MYIKIGSYVHKTDRNNTTIWRMEGRIIAIQ